jgi:hypothetical protein
MHHLDMITSILTCIRRIREQQRGNEWVVRSAKRITKDVGLMVVKSFGASSFEWSRC